MGQTVKARGPITKRPERNTSHKTARKLAAKHSAQNRNTSSTQKRPPKKSSQKFKKQSIKKQITDLSSSQNLKTDETTKPPDKKTKASIKKAASKQRAPKKIARKKNIISQSNKNKKTKNSQKTPIKIESIPFILEHKADNILYYTQSGEDTSLISEENWLKSDTPIKPKSFAPISAIRDPLAEYMMLRKEKEKNQLKNIELPKANSEKKLSPLPTSSLHIENIASSNAPLPRSSALTVTSEGPLHILAYWLRTSRYKLLNIFKRKAHNKETLKKRSKADILNELAGLRAENAMLRKRLDKKPMPFGRKKFDMQ